MHYIICIYLFICFKFLTNFYHFPFLIIIQLIFGSWNEGQILFILNLSISKISYFALGCIHRLRIVQKFFLLPILSLFSPPFFVFAKLLTSKPFRRLRFLSRQNSLPPCTQGLRVCLDDCTRKTPLFATRGKCTVHYQPICLVLARNEMWMETKNSYGLWCTIGVHFEKIKALEIFSRIWRENSIHLFVKFQMK